MRCLKKYDNSRRPAESATVVRRAVQCTHISKVRRPWRPNRVKGAGAVTGAGGVNSAPAALCRRRLRPRRPAPPVRRFGPSLGLRQPESPGPAGSAAGVRAAWTRGRRYEAGSHAVALLLLEDWLECLYPDGLSFTGLHRRERVLAL